MASLGCEHGSARKCFLLNDEQAASESWARAARSRPIFLRLMEFQQMGRLEFAIPTQKICLELTCRLACFLCSFRPPS
jgi:hypothetical protein